MSDEPTFRSDLYRGTAGHYDQFRVGYPGALIDDLALRTHLSGAGRLLDLACGTGQIALPLAEWFGEVWAVDQESDMVDVVREKSVSARLSHVRAIVSPAESLVAPSAAFELVTIGTAFHRLQRTVLATHVFRWLQPGGFLALVWAESPWTGDAPWQRALRATVDRWAERSGGADRIPAGWEADRVARPDRIVLEQSGFDPVGTYEFPTEHEWTVDQVIGFVFSTSLLSRRVLGDRAATFEGELRGELVAAAPDGRFTQTINFAYELAQHP